MKKIRTDEITVNTYQPFSDVSLSHLQEGTREGLLATLEALGINTSVTLQRVAGCKWTFDSNTNTYSVTAGWLLHNGELLRFAGGSIQVAAGEVAVWAEQTNYHVNDPVQIYDDSDLPVGTRNIHADRVAVLGKGPSSGPGGLGTLEGTTHATDLAWTNLALKNGSSAGSFNRTPQVTKDRNGFVHWRGTMQISSSSPFDVPAGFRPQGQLTLWVTRSGNSGPTEINLYGPNDGAALVIAASGTLFLDGVSYYAG